jgi:signal transduction histidine kinase
LSALLFLLALAPPAPLRYMWRRTEAAEVQQTIWQLMTATTEDEVVDRVLPPMAAMVGAAGAKLRAADGTLLGEYGQRAGERVEIALPSGGAVVVHTSAYAPYFGDDELDTLRTVGTLAELALDRSRLFSQEREARQVLERADELKTNFIALAAHELRNPVTVVHGLVDTLDRLGDELTEDQRAEMRAALREQTNRLRLLIEQLLDLSRLDADAIAITPELVRVRERVRAIVDFAAPDRRGEVAVDVAEDLEAKVDPQVLDRVVSNLVVNALRHGRAPVTVRAEQRDRHFRVTVQDSGPGVAPEFIPDLFERFTRSRSSRENVSGTGLGLAIARSYARAHRGDLLYEQAKPTGARFELVIPNGNGSSVVRARGIEPPRASRPTGT